MIKLVTEPYCENCDEFDPRVTERPQKLYGWADNYDYGSVETYGDTVVECSKLKNCRRLVECLKRQMEKENEDVTG